MTLFELTRLFARIGCLSFGGPAAQIALMQKELVDERPLLSADDFLKALSFCMLLPGPEAMQLATYAGWKLQGLRGGMIAGGLFVLPGAVVIAVLAALYAQFGTLPAVQTAFLGIKAAVIVIVAQALWRLWGKALNQSAHRVIAAVSFIALFAFNLPFPLVIGCAALFGIWRAAPPATTAPVAQPSKRGTTHAPKILIAGLTFWAAPLLAAWAAGAQFLLSLGLFFSKLALVTFGGAYAVLAYMTQEIVTTRGWLSTAQMIDALGLAETTPGPLILVTQFTAILAGLFAGGAGLATLSGLMALWVTFVPCFLWIFLGAPFIDRLDTAPRLRAGLSAVTAAVVGVIANLSIWFGVRVLFSQTVAAPAPFAFELPVPASFDPAAAVLTALAAALLIWRKIPLFPSLILLAAASVFIPI